MKAISGECQHAVVVSDIDRKKMRNVVRKTCAERRKTCEDQETIKRKYN